MLKNHLKIAWRNLLRNKTFSIINITGLAIGLCCFLLIALYVLDELSYDRYNENADRIYRVNAGIRFGGADLNFPLSSDMMGQVLKKDYPQVEAYARIYNSSGNKFIKKGNEYINEYNVMQHDASALTVDAKTASYSQSVFDEIGTTKNTSGQKYDTVSLKSAANWIVNVLFSYLKRDGIDIEHCPITPKQLASQIKLELTGEISGKMAKDLFEIIWTGGGDPADEAEKRGMKQVTDTGAIEAAVDAIIAANPDQVEKARANPKLAGWFVGQVIKATGGKANPAAVNDLVAKKLGL